jgi:dTDP-4-amino-4,6-dideoxygalactose transaminase
MEPIGMLNLKLQYAHMKEDIDAAIRKCLNGQRWILGPEVEEFEKRMADYLAIRHCIGVASGTDALVLSLRALAIKTKGEEYFSRDDEIVTTSFSFTATGDAILRAGATPVFVDIDPETCNLSEAAVREAVISNKDPGRVVGIVPVHLYGRSCPMDRILEIAGEFKLWVVEDAAQALGARHRERQVGTWGSAGAFSFFPSKNLGAFGDAGMVATNDPEIADLVRMLLGHGGKDKYDVQHIGYNSRIDTLQAAILNAKMNYLDDFNSRRSRIAWVYNRSLADLERLRLPGIGLSSCGSPENLGWGNGHVFHQYTTRTPERDGLQRYLSQSGIASMVYYPVPLHKMKVFGGRSRSSGTLRQAEALAAEVLSLPMDPLLTDSQLDFICETTRRFFQTAPPFPCKG